MISGIYSSLDHLITCLVGLSVICGEDGKQASE